MKTPVKLTTERYLQATNVIGWRHPDILALT